MSQEAENPTPSGSLAEKSRAGGVWGQVSQNGVPSLQQSLLLCLPLGVGALMALGCLMATKRLQGFQTLLLHLSLVKAREWAQGTEVLSLSGRTNLGQSHMGQGNVISC